MAEGSRLAESKANGKLLPGRYAKATFQPIAVRFGGE